VPPRPCNRCGAKTTCRVTLPVAVGGKGREIAGADVGEELVVGEQWAWWRVGVDEAGLFSEREQGRAETEAGPMRPEFWGQVATRGGEVAGTSGEAGCGVSGEARNKSGGGRGMVVTDAHERQQRVGASGGEAEQI
jgi:hypothetical protein